MSKLFSLGKFWRCNFIGTSRCGQKANTLIVGRSHFTVYVRTPSHLPNHEADCYYYIESEGCATKQKLPK